MMKMQSVAIAVGLLVSGGEAFVSNNNNNNKRKYVGNNVVRSMTSTSSPSGINDASVPGSGGGAPQQEEMAVVSMQEIAAATQKRKKIGPDMSQAIPFLERPPVLTGELAGDVGFDPLRLAKNKESLWAYREAEIKHGRLAMLVSTLIPEREREREREREKA